MESTAVAILTFIVATLQHKLKNSFASVDFSVKLIYHLPDARSNVKSRKKNN